MFRSLLILSVILAGTIATSCSDDAGGTGGRTGTGGTAGNGGSGTGGGFGPPPCIVSELCVACPADPVCGSEDDCAAGFTCVSSGCSTLEGAEIGICVPLPGGACQTTDQCPPDRECIEQPPGGKRCVKVTPGCDSDRDCVLGFDCEEGECVDRRVPCISDPDCPKNHICVDDGNSQFCHRVHRTCTEFIDCAGAGPLCADIDGDGTKECAGVIDPNQSTPTSCVNSACTEPSAPVCEMAGISTTTICGQYGLCNNGGCADGFECVALWPDGRTECVPTGGSCSSYRDCPIRQVCASPREGGPPACQSGLAE